jgi:hypothetical protein
MGSERGQGWHLAALRTPNAGARGCENDLSDSFKWKFNFREDPKGEVRINSIPRTPVNKGKREGLEPRYRCPSRRDFGEPRLAEVG